MEPLATNGTIGKITNGTIGRTPNGARNGSGSVRGSPNGTIGNYTPGIYAEGYIVFVFPFVRSSVRMFVCSFEIPSRSWNLRQSFALKFLKWCISQQLLIRKHS